MGCKFSSRSINTPVHCICSRSTAYLYVFRAVPTSVQTKYTMYFTFINTPVDLRLIQHTGLNTKVSILTLVFKPVCCINRRSTGVLMNVKYMVYFVCTDVGTALNTYKYAVLLLQIQCTGVFIEREENLQPTHLKLSTCVDINRPSNSKPPSDY